MRPNLIRPALIISILAACGDDPVRHTPDAAPGTPDASHADASPDAAASHVVSITVKVAGAPQSDVVVDFQNADNSLVSTTMTDANGTASATMENGGFVTAVEPFGTGTNEVYSYAAVKGGDHLLLEQPAAPATISFSLVFPADNNDVSISQYKFHSNCGNQDDVSPTGNTITLSGCGPTIDVVVEAVDAANTTLSAFFHPDVAITAGATVTLTDTLALVNNTSMTFNNAANVSGGTLSIIGQLATAKGIVHDFPTRFLTATGGTATDTVALPSFAGAVQIIDTSTNLTQNGNQHIIEWRPQTASYTLDVEATLLQGYTTYPVFDPATHAFTWTLSGTTTQGDFVIASAAINRSSSKRSWQWFMAAPATGTTLELPVIPAGAFDFNPSATDGGFLDNLITAKVPGGYDAARARVLSTSGPGDFVIGTSGTLVYEMPYAAPFARSARPSLRVPESSRARLLRRWLRP